MQLSVDKINELSLEYGKAFYLLDSVQFTENFHALKREFSDIYPNFNIAYSYKTNYIPKLCKIVDREGGYAEVVSEMELELAFRIGVKPERIIWNGPIKNKDDVEKLLLSGGTVNIDSYSEFLEISSFLDNHSESQFNLGIRCNYSVGDGVISRFGIDTESDEFKETVLAIDKRNNVILKNLQCHFAKRSLKFWPARAEGMVKTVEKVRNLTGKTPERIDLGGGLYGHMEPSLKAQFQDEIPDYNAYAKAVAVIIRNYFGENGPELLLEPGSALAGDCMKFVSRVESVKNVRGKTFIAIMGSQKNISMTGVNPPIEVLRQDESAGGYYSNADMVGYTCIEGDVLYHNFTGKIQTGDYVVISNCGSYSVVMKPPFILPNFPILDISNNNVELVKRAETFEDIFKTYVCI